MKPRNFPGRKLRRRARALRRIPLLVAPDGRRCSVTANPAQHHDYFVLHGHVPRFYVEPPTDIRIRIGAAGRKT
jgi:hypothetical protein